MKYFLIVFICFTGFSYAAPNTSRWKCQAIDRHNRSYSGKAPAIEMAMQKAYSNCRNASSVRSSCKTAPNMCQRMSQKSPANTKKDPILALHNSPS